MSLSLSPPAAQSPQHFHLIFISTAYSGPQLIMHLILQFLSSSLTLLPSSWGFAQRHVQPSARVSQLHEPDGTSCYVRASVTLDSTQSPVIRQSPASAHISHCQRYTGILHNIQATSLEVVPGGKQSIQRVHI